MSKMIGLVTLLVRDYDEAIVFFAGLLRFALVEDRPMGGGKRWVVVAPPGAGGTALLLARAATPEQADRIGDQAGGRVFLFLGTDDFRRDYREMKSRGIAFAEEPREESYGTVAVFLDLYGNRWDLVQRRDVPGRRPAMEMTLRPMSTLTGAERADLAALSRAVYPPEEAEAWPGRPIEWAAPEWGIFFRGGDGALIAFAGIVVRPAFHDGQPVRVGGVGGVKTHPSARRRGFAGLALGHAAAFFRDRPDIAFGLLVCEPHLIAYYGRLGWREFSGRLMVTQRGRPSEFTLNRVMVLGVRGEAPTTGTIDLAGPPW